MIEEIFKVSINDHYTKRYLKLIQHFKNRCINLENKKYFKHHILPKSLFPQYRNLRISDWNLCKVTAREHFILHRILSKAVGGSMIFAFHLMCHKKDYSENVNSRLYEVMINDFSKEISRRMQGNIPWNKGLKMSEEHYAKLLEAIKNRDISGDKNPNYSNYWSDEQKNNLSLKAIERWSDPNFKEKQIGVNHPMYGKRGENNPNYGRCTPEETKKKISESLKGRKLPEEQKLAISKSSKGKPKVKRSKCIHCGIETDNGNISKSHNDKCKYKPNNTLF